MKIFAARLTAALLVVAAMERCGFGAVKVDEMFCDRMVLQRDMPVPVWGTASVDEEVTVTFAGQTKTATAETIVTPASARHRTPAVARWQVKLDALKASAEGGVLTITSALGGGAIELADVLVGEVWVGSGQSNMGGKSTGYMKSDSALAAMVMGGPYPKLRLYNRAPKADNRNRLVGQWSIADEEESGKFSALMFSFGLSLHSELDVPVGLIVGAVGGTPSGLWLTPEMFAADAGCQAALERAGTSPEAEWKKYEEQLAEWRKVAGAAKKVGKRPSRGPRRPTKIGGLYRNKIGHIVPYAIRGVLWDQGESGTAVKGVDQRTLMGALIRGWRKDWGRDFPFLYIQKPNGGGCYWDYEVPLFHKYDGFTEQPTRPDSSDDGTYRELHIGIARHPNTAMVSTSDLGFGVHPRNKSGYGKRACRVALGFVYGREVEIYGPTYASHRAEGGSLRVSLNHVGRGLTFRNGEKLRGFEIAGADGVYRWADARIDSETVVLTSDKVARPIHVRYGWASKRRTWANLFNRDGLPALTFRTGVEGAPVTP